MLERLVHGLPGHPLHPPLTDATIGSYSLATALAVLSYAGAVKTEAAHGAWLGLIGGLIVTVPTAATGFADWITLEWGSAVWRTATAHLSAMLVATTLFALAAWLDKSGYDAGRVAGSGLALALLGFVCLTVGGWLGGSIVFVHGVRVLRRAPGGEAAASPTQPQTTEVTR